MKVIFPIILILSLLFMYAFYLTLSEDKPATNTHGEMNKSLSVTSLNVDKGKINQQKEHKLNVQLTQFDTEAKINIPENKTEPEQQKSQTDQTSNNESLEDSILFNLDINESTHHMIMGTAKTDTGKLEFTSKLLPSNEVKLSIKLEQDKRDDIELMAYFDLANYTMELDGKNNILNKEHKQILSLASSQLGSSLGAQYEGYDFPDHALMLTQMLAYWSISPEGYVHEKRAIVSQ